MNHTLEEETVFVPVESRILIILFDCVVTENQAVYRFSIQDRGIECFKLVILNDYITMEILFLVFQVGYFRIDGNNGICELEHIRQ